MKIDPSITYRIDYFICILLASSQINSAHLFNMIGVKHMLGMYELAPTLSIHASCCYVAILAGDYHPEGCEYR